MALKRLPSDYWYQVGQDRPCPKADNTVFIKDRSGRILRREKGVSFAEAVKVTEAKKSKK